LFFVFCSFLPDIPCIVSGIGSILLFFPLTYTLDLFAAALHVHKCTKAHLDFDPQLLSVIVNVAGTGELNPGLQLPIMSLMHILLKSIDADMKSEIGSSRGGLRPYPLRFHVGEAGADAKLIQHGPLGVAYHRRHPISTVPVARITAHATVPG
jgi:hypothetical protein